MKTRMILIALLCLCLLAAGLAPAPEIARHAFTGGGGSAEAGIYTLDAAIGQPVAGESVSGAYDLDAGVLSGRRGGAIYLPLIRK